ncbi:MAG: efflux RND transporter periplasmic adaptor subunit [Candidatus Aminicenantes bacterium]|nr:efflux RND transporter periplasmic adaptor subunit [Candidatus Aminicenantes bacterium]
MSEKVKIQYKQIRIILVILTFFFFLSCGKGDSPSEKSSLPAKVENMVEELKLATVTLTQKAEERLGLEIVSVEKRNMPGSLNIGGEIMASPGHDVKVASPVAGTIFKTESGQIPTAGKWVKRGEQIMRLLILPPENSLIGAQEELSVKQEQYDNAKSKFDRAALLLSSKAISEKVYEENQVELIQAQAALTTAKARLNLLNGGELKGDEKGLSVIVLVSPLEGVLQRIFVAHGQTVPASADLFEVASLDPLWVRVPVYIGDLEKVDLFQNAVIELLGSKDNTTIYKARPVQGPPLSDANSASADLYFELTNPDKLLRIGQKVSVTLLKKSSNESLVVPVSAILYDIYGGTWVYTRIAPRTYARSRVEMSHLIDKDAVLLRGLKEGDQIVSAAVAELYGTEFGVGK